MITLNGLRHHIYKWGNPNHPKLFLFHGWMDSGLTFAPLAEALASHYHCIAVDFRGFGKTEHTPDPIGYFYDQFFCDIHDLLNFFSPSQPALVLGHSMGGNLLTYYCGIFPDRIKAFINLEGLGVSKNTHREAPNLVKKWIESRTQLKSKTYSSPEIYKTRYLKRYPGVTAQNLDKILDGLLMHLPQTNEWALRADLKHFMPLPEPSSSDEITPFLKKTRAKCLFLVGTQSSFIPTWLRNEFLLLMVLKWRLRQLSALQIKLVKGAGHMLHLEQPKEISQMILKFLEP